MKTHTITKPESSPKQPGEAAGKSSFCKRLGLCLAAVACLSLAPAAAAAAKAMPARLHADPTFTQVGPNQYHVSGPVWLIGATPNSTYIVVLRHPTTGRPASQRVIRADAQGRALIGNLTETAAAGSHITLGLYFYDRSGRALCAGTPVIRFPASSHQPPPVTPPPPSRPVVTPPTTPPAVSYANLSGKWTGADNNLPVIVQQSGGRIAGTNGDGSTWTGQFTGPDTFTIEYTTGGNRGGRYDGRLFENGRKITWNNGQYIWVR